MPDGTKLNGPEDLHKALAARGDQLAQVITEKLMTYAVGRHIDFRDMPAVRRIVQHGRGQQLPLRGHRAGSREQRRLPPPRSTRAAQVDDRAGRQYHPLFRFVRTLKALEA